MRSDAFSTAPMEPRFVLLLDAAGRGNRSNPWATGASALINGSLVGLLLLAGLRAHPGPPHFAHPANPLASHPIDLRLPAGLLGSLGGGGDHSPVEAIRGRPPRVDPNPILAPTAAVLTHPALAVDPAVAAPVALVTPENERMTNLGVARSSNVSLLSNGPGDGGGQGPSSGPGSGPGRGSSWCPGGDCLAGNSYTAGDPRIVAPVAIYAPNPEFSDEARRQKFQGLCLIAVLVDAQGNPRNPKVLRPLGMGLDEKALEAVRQYRFKPGRRDGKPVAVTVYVQVDFRMY